MTDAVRRSADRGGGRSGVRSASGIDPHPALLDAWGLPRRRGRAGAVRPRHGGRRSADQVAVFKPQSAFFEAHGVGRASPCWSGSWPTSPRRARSSLLDVKRGDIGSTMDAYAAAYLADGSPLAADAITVSPYLGFGSLAGAIDAGRCSRAAASTCWP